jgi:hypothetical protein
LIKHLLIQLGLPTSRPVRQSIRKYRLQ